MIFNFLRQYLKDEEFDQTKLELAQTQQVLEEYKEFLTQFQANNNERKKVEPDFLTLMWASVGIAIAIFISAGQEAVKLVDQLQKEPKSWVWIGLTLFAFYFIWATGKNALDLTKKYVMSKDDPIYKDYEWYLRTGVSLIALATLALAFLK